MSLAEFIYKKARDYSKYSPPNSSPESLVSIMRRLVS
jgi:hypothetical protein